MMKKYIISIMVLALLSLVAIPQVHAVDVSKEQCREMLALGDKAMTDKNFETAKNYYKRAIKYDPWSTTAWSKYDLLVKVTSGDGAADISGFDFFSTKAAPKQAVEEESDDDLFGGGGAPSFEGC